MKLILSLFLSASALKLQQGGLRVHPESISAVIDGADGKGGPKWSPATPGMQGHYTTLEGQTLADQHFTFGQGCPDPAHPKLAFCVVGDARTFAEKETVGRFVDNAFQPAKQAGAIGITRGDPDVFVDMHTKADKTAACQASIDLLKPTKSTLVEGDGGADRKDLDASCWSRLLRMNKPIEWLMDYYKSVYGCYEKVKEAEEQSGKKFDMVVLNRPDHQWADDNSEEFNKMKASYNEDGPIVTFGGGPVPSKVQCAKSLLKRDYYGFHTRSNFEDFGRLYVDQILGAAKGTMCGNVGKFEHLPLWYVVTANTKNPDSVLYSSKVSWTMYS